MDSNSNGMVEVPANGLAGLKHWKHDLVSGLIVSLIALPFSLGIAVASGAPPIAGLVSSVIAGLIVPFLGGSYLTISGPAAGLAPALLAIMTTLGRGNLEVGYPLLLCVIAMTGAVQIVLSLLRLARFSAVFPSAVVEGMLASIGFLIIAKQMPNFLGHEYRAHEFFGIILETPEEFWKMDPWVFGLSSICLVAIFTLTHRRVRPILRGVPPQLVVVGLGIALGQAFGIDAEHLIHMPKKVLEHGIVPPHFEGLLADRGLWLAALAGVLTLTLIDGVESLATAAAIDRIDPFRRKSDPNRTLLAMGICNVCSSLAGGLTIIPGGVKSKANIEAGGRTIWANVYVAGFLLLYLFVAKDLIRLIPLGALAAILIHTGFKMCQPAVWRHVAHIGREQLLLFTLTVATTLATDLLIGILAGLVAKLLMTLWFKAEVEAERVGRVATVVDKTVRSFASVRHIFCNPVVSTGYGPHAAYYVRFDRPMVCFNSLPMTEALESIPEEARKVRLHIGSGVVMIDHTSCERLLHFVDEFRRTERGDIEIVGLERMRMRSEYVTCMRLGEATPPTLESVPDEVREGQEIEDLQVLN